MPRKKQNKPRIQKCRVCQRSVEAPVRASLLVDFQYQVSPSSGANLRQVMRGGKARLVSPAFVLYVVNKCR